MDITLRAMLPAWVRNRTMWGGIVAAVTAVAGIATIVDVFGGSHDKPPAHPISITSPDNGVISRCAKFVGKAEVREGHDLWVSYEAPGGKIGFAKAELRSDGIWTVTTTVGGRTEAHLNYIVRVFYLSHEDSNFIRGIDGYADNGNDGYWLAEHMPTGARDPLVHPVKRDGSNDAAPCTGSTVS